MASRGCISTFLGPSFRSNRHPIPRDPSLMKKILAPLNLFLKSRFTRFKFGFTYYNSIFNQDKFSEMSPSSPINQPNKLLSDFRRTVKKKLAEQLRRNLGYKKKNPQVAPKSMVYHHRSKTGLLQRNFLGKMLCKKIHCPLALQHQPTFYKVFDFTFPKISRADSESSVHAPISHSFFMELKNYKLISSYARDEEEFRYTLEDRFANGWQNNAENLVAVQSELRKSQTYPKNQTD
jgi:hypothetical protein